MNRFHNLLALLASIGLVLTLVCLSGAAMGEISWMRYATGPLFAIVVASWWSALSTATRIADAESAVFLPGLKQLVGIWLGARFAPIWSILLSALSILSLLFLGASGSVSGLPSTPNEAKITGSVFVMFLAFSLPILLSRHPSASRSARSDKSPERTRGG